MAINLEEGRMLIQTVLGYPVSIRPGMNYFLEYCDRSHASDAWKKISGLDFDKDCKHITSWLKKTLSHHPPESNIRAYWFGLSTIVLNDGESSCDLYVSGSVRFNPEDKTADWANLGFTSYLPEGCYAKSSILDQMYYQIHHHEVAEVGEYILSLGYACLAVKAAWAHIDPKYLSGMFGPRPVAVGFERGDYIIVIK